MSYFPIPSGVILDYAGTTAPSGWMICPTVQTNISRTLYPELFAAIGTTWGAGDGSTTFGMPWFPADHVAVQANANVGTATAGAAQTHGHQWTQANYPNYAGAVTGYAGNPVGGVITTGGPMNVSGNNLAAGVRVTKIVKL